MADVSNDPRLDPRIKALLGAFAHRAVVATL